MEDCLLAGVYSRRPYSIDSELNYFRFILGFIEAAYFVSLEKTEPLCPCVSNQRLSPDVYSTSPHGTLAKNSVSVLPYCTLDLSSPVLSLDSLLPVSLVVWTAKPES